MGHLPLSRGSLKEGTFPVLSLYNGGITEKREGPPATSGRTMSLSQVQYGESRSGARRSHVYS